MSSAPRLRGDDLAAVRPPRSSGSSISRPPRRLNVPLARADDVVESSVPSTFQLRRRILCLLTDIGTSKCDPFWCSQNACPFASRDSRGKAAAPITYRLLTPAMADDLRSLHGFSFKVNSHCPD